jgi:hypothetical protein
MRPRARCGSCLSRIAGQAWIAASGLYASPPSAGQDLIVARRSSLPDRLRGYSAWCLTRSGVLDGCASPPRTCAASASRLGRAERDHGVASPEFMRHLRRLIEYRDHRIRVSVCLLSARSSLRSRSGQSPSASSIFPKPLRRDLRFFLRRAPARRVRGDAPAPACVHGGRACRSPAPVLGR